MKVKFTSGQLTSLIPVPITGIAGMTKHGAVIYDLCLAVLVRGSVSTYTWSSILYSYPSNARYRVHTDSLFWDCLYLDSCTAYTFAKCTHHV